jgi:hypothetical protein
MPRAYGLNTATEPPETQQGDDVPERINVRLDVPTRGALGSYLAANRMTISQGVRVLLALALREDSESPERALRAAAFREGLVAGIAEIRNRVTTAIRLSIEAALAELERRA